MAKTSDSPVASFASGNLVSVSDKHVNVVVRIDPAWRYLDAWTTMAGNPGALTTGEGFTALFTTLDEDGLQETFGVNYADTEIVGRAEAYKTYTGGANREIVITFEFHVQENIQTEVVDPARWLDALKMPVVQAGVTHGPPPVHLIVGKLVEARCVVTQADIQWLAPFEPATMLPHGARVACTFTVVRTPGKTGSVSGSGKFMQAPG